MKELNKEIILEKISSIKDQIKQLNVKKLILFGSYARDEQNNESDIDFLVEFEKDNSVDDYLNLLHLLEDTFDKKIDLVKPHLIRNELKKFIIEGKQYEAKI